MKTYEEYKNEYFSVRNEKDYKSLLEDPNTPEVFISSIVEELTITEFMIIAFKHPNITEQSQIKILGKVDIKDNQKELIEIFLSNKSDLSESTWLKIKGGSKTPIRFDICVMELLDEQKDIFSTQKLDVIFNSLVKDGSNILGYMKSVVHHKNFDEKILEGEFIKSRYFVVKNILKDDIEGKRLYPIFSTSPHKTKIFTKMFELTNDLFWLPKEAQDVFVF